MNLSEYRIFQEQNVELKKKMDIFCFEWIQKQLNTGRSSKKLALENIINSKERVTFSYRYEAKFVHVEIEIDELLSDGEEFDIPILEIPFINEKINEEDSNLSSAEIYCVGKCRGNPGPAGSGIVLHSEGLRTLYFGDYDPVGANDSAELKALIKALKVSKDFHSCTIFIDSIYAKNCVSLWAYSWEKMGWTKKGGIKNLNLIKEAHLLYDEQKESIKIEYLEGHSGDKNGDLADYLANMAMDREQVGFSILEKELEKGLIVFNA